MKREGYFTVEATFIVTICIVVIMAILYTGLYVHDRIIVSNFVRSYTALWARTPEEKRASEGELEEKLGDELRKRLFLFEVDDVSVGGGGGIVSELVGGMISKTTTVKYSLPVSLSFLKRAWSEDGEREESAGYSLIVPAKMKWDADAVKGDG